MQSKSSPFVKIKYLNKKLIKEEILKKVKELGQKHPEIEKILLFGSIARGDAVPGSDVDLLIILRESKIPFLDRIPIYTPSFFIGVDVFPYTKLEINAMQDNFFLKKAFEEGIEVYNSSDVLYIKFFQHK